MCARFLPTELTIAQSLATRRLELVSEGSIYPLLSRLQKKGYIAGYFVESAGGPPRKYYRIEKSGRQQLADWSEEWNRLSAGVGGVLDGHNGGHHG